MKRVVVIGGTGYIGRPLVEKLCLDGFRVTAIARPRSVARLPPGCEVVSGDALDSGSYRDGIPRGATFVHLVGTPHPAPWKANEFRAIDLESLYQSLAAAKQAEAQHFVFVSVAQPAPVMKAYIEVRIQRERRIREAGVNATIVRPWYVLGPGHYWPYLLIPVYKILEWIPTTRSGSVRLGLVTRQQMVNTLASAIRTMPFGVRVLETHEIRAGGATIQ